MNGGFVSRSGTSTPGITYSGKRPIVLIMGYAGGWTVWLSAVEYFGSKGVAIAMGIYGIFVVWRARQDSNLWPPD